MASSDEPHDEPSGEPPTPEGETPAPDEPASGIIRRHPTAPVPEPLGDDTRTSIIRRRPSGDPSTNLVPPLEPPTNLVTPLEPLTNLVAPLDEPETGLIPLAARRAHRARKPLGNLTAVAAAAAAIITGWATAVVATELITGWWRTDRLFCIGVGFLTGVFGASTIAGVVALLLGRRVGIFLTLVAAVLALLIFACIFVAGAHMAGIVRAIPVLPVATALLAVAPATWRWTR